MNLAIWILFGGIAGGLASVLTGTTNRHGLIGNTLVGIIGAVFGGLILRLLGDQTLSEFNFYSLFISVMGACIMLFGFRSLRS